MPSNNLLKTFLIIIAIIGAGFIVYYLAEGFEEKPKPKVVYQANEKKVTSRPTLAKKIIKDKYSHDLTIINFVQSQSPCDGFDFPVGPPNAKKYYNAQGFGINNHLGEDWNGIRGGNSDLGDAVYSIGDGVVFFAKNVGGGWGNIVRIVHKIKSKSSPIYIESFYAHADNISVQEGDLIKRGEKLGTIGNVGGLYYAHLHFELRTIVGMPIMGGYSKIRTGFTSPTRFIKSHRPSKRKRLRKKPENMIRQKSIIPLFLSQINYRGLRKK